jgi:hypothetical protein
MPRSDIVDEAPIDQLDLDPLLPGRGMCGAMISWCGTGQDDDVEKKSHFQMII